MNGSGKKKWKEGEMTIFVLSSQVSELVTERKGSQVREKSLVDGDSRTEEIVC